MLFRQNRPSETTRLKGRKFCLNHKLSDVINTLIIPVCLKFNVNLNRKKNTDVTYMQLMEYKNKKQ